MNPYLAKLLANTVKVTTRAAQNAASAKLSGPPREGTSCTPCAAMAKIAAGEARVAQATGRKPRR